MTHDDLLIVAAILCLASGNILLAVICYLVWCWRRP